MKDKTVMPLTATEIDALDEIALDKKANDATFSRAAMYHCNRSNEIYKAERKIWEHLAERLNLDLANNTYKVNTVNSIVQVVEVTKEDK